jgi:uncharacterized protein (DUF924 family)
VNRTEILLDFWFGQTTADRAPSAERVRFWFGGDRATDQSIRNQFAADVAAAAAGRYDDWAGHAPGSLALILLLDQFPRNIHRETPQAYAFDPLALKVALASLADGQDRLLAPVQRAFLYLPLEHAEALDCQERSVALFTRLLAEAPPPLEGTCRGFLDYAVRHRDIIARFGRFPHRNAVLDRPSSDEEIRFLQQPGSSF